MLMERITPYIFILFALLSGCIGLEEPVDEPVEPFANMVEINGIDNFQIGIGEQTNYSTGEVVGFKSQFQVLEDMHVIAKASIGFTHSWRIDVIHDGNAWISHLSEWRNPRESSWFGIVQPANVAGQFKFKVYVESDIGVEYLGEINSQAFYN